MEVRYLTDDDSLYELSHIYEESWKCAYKNIVPQEYLDSIPEGRWASGTLTAEGRHNLVLAEGEKLVGTSCFCRSRWDEFPDHGEIVSLYLLPGYVGKGHGKMLLERALKELKCLGFSNVVLWTLEENVHARLFYEMNGFRYSGISRNENIGGKMIRELLYIYEGEKYDIQ